MKARIKLPLLAIIFGCCLTLSCKKGDTGAAGTPGTNGSTILSGNGAPSTSLGNVGDFYLDMSAFMFYGPKTSGGWGTGVPIRGQQGNANVFTDTFTVANSQWGFPALVYTTLNSGASSFDSAKFCNRSEPHLTQDILNKGMVIGSFISEPILAPTSWDPLPFNYQVSGTGYNVNFSYLADLNVIHLYFFYQFVTGGKPPVLKNTVLSPLRYKFVFIGGQIGMRIRDLVQQSRAAQLQ
jgi:hypothetical protein